MTHDCSTPSERARENDNHTFVIAKSVGKGLGRIKNVRWSWRKLKRNLGEPLVDTSVTYAQYEALDQDEKLVKKRAPGSWTPSRYKSNRRAVADLREKTLVVFDLDYITHDQLDDIRLGLAPITRWAWFMHTSRSHTPESPRARMVLPVSRPMSPDEGHAVFRLLAQYLADEPSDGIEIPDLVSFRSNQTMFWPSISKGQEFWTDENIGEILDVDEFLAENPGWENFENLPYQEEESKRGITDPNKRMEDPYKKPEPIGAWCRCYTVQEVIENWLEDIYAPGDSESEERYTYLLGTGSNGAVVYEDGKFLHSNHGSDEVETANAFDLLRIHKFRHLDDNSHANTSPGNKPSFKAMVEFARNDERVIGELNSHMDDLLDDLAGEDDTAEVDEDLLGPAPSEEDTGSDDPSNLLDDLPDDEAEPDEPKKKHAWMKHFRRKANGDLDSVAVSNVTLILENDPRVKGCIGYNEFLREPVCLKPIRSPKINLPTAPVAKPDKRYGREWQDSDDMGIKIMLSADAARHGYETDFSRENIEAGVMAAGMQNKFHPIQDLFKSAHEKYVASGRASKGAIETVPQRYLGCPDDVFHRESSRLLMVALAARAFEPGCKFDTVTIIRGSQGGGKSWFWRTLARGFFNELPKDFDRTDKMVEAMKGTLVAEMGEMAGLRRETAEVAKEFITRQTDKIRLAYGRRVGQYKRHTVLTGTSNLDQILHDPTGNRRFWIWVDDHSEENPIDIEGLQAEMEMLWGEANDEYLKMRKAQPEGELHLDLKSKQARAFRNRLADQFRARSTPEKLADLIEQWMGEPVDSGEVDVVDVSPDVEPEDRVVRNLVCVSDAMEGLQSNVIARSYTQTTDQAYGSALMELVKRGFLEKHGKRCRRLGKNTLWYFRKGSSVRAPQWVLAPDDSDDADSEIDDLLG